MSNKWIHSTIRDMQVSDSIRYREAVTRLKRLLYDSHYKIEPSTMKSQNERRNYAQKLTESFEKDEEKDLSQDLETSTNSGILAMVKQQDELITQLEKENIFLKAEMVSTLEASKEIALQNEEFRRRLTNTLAQMEASQDFSLPSDGQEKVHEIMNCLKEEREHLLEGLKLQEETIAALRKRETEAIDKVKQAVELAEDSHKISEKVKDCSESSQAELQTQAQIIQGRLLATQKQLQRAKDREKENEKIIMDQERRIVALEGEKNDLGMETNKKEIELEKKVRNLDLKLKDVEGDKLRLEKLLREQKNTSESTLRRLEALLDRRNLEAESFMARRSSLEKQIREAKDENQRLIEAVNELAKDRGHRTDDDKSAKQTTHIPLQTREELDDIKATVRNHENSIASLHSAVSTVREEMTRGMDDLRLNLEEVCSAIKEEKSETNLQSYDSGSHAADPISIEMPIEQPPPQSNRSEGYGSLRGQTPPPTLLVERKARTELIEDSIPLSGYDHTFSKIIVPLPRKGKHGGVFPKIKEQDVESKDVDESEFNKADQREISKRGQPPLGKKDKQIKVNETLDKITPRKNNIRIFEDIEEKPEVTEEEHEKPEVTEGEHEKPKVDENEKEKPAVAEEEYEKTEVDEKEQEKPEVAEKEYEKPEEVDDKEQEKPEAAEEEREKPEVVEKEQEKLEVAEKEYEKPEVDEKEQEKPKAAEKEQEKPEVAEEVREKPKVAEKEQDDESTKRNHDRENEGKFCDVKGIKNQDQINVMNDGHDEVQEQEGNEKWKSEARLTTYQSEDMNFKERPTNLREEGSGERDDDVAKPMECEFETVDDDVSDDESLKEERTENKVESTEKMGELEGKPNEVHLQQAEIIETMSEAQPTAVREKYADELSEKTTLEKLGVEEKREVIEKPGVETKVLMAEETITSDESVEKLVPTESVPAEESVEDAISTSANVTEKATDIKTAAEKSNEEQEEPTEVAHESSPADKDKTDDELIVTEKTIVPEEAVGSDNIVGTEKIIVAEDMKVETAETDVGAAEVLEEK